MGAMASQITSLAIFYPTVYSGEDQRKHQSSASLAFVRWPVNSPHKVVHAPGGGGGGGGGLVPFWVASSPIHFLKAQNLYFMKKFGSHVNKVA